MNPGVPAPRVARGDVFISSAQKLPHRSPSKRQRRSPRFTSPVFTSRQRGASTNRLPIDYQIGINHRKSRKPHDSRSRLNPSSNAGDAMKPFASQPSAPIERLFPLSDLIPAPFITFLLRDVRKRIQL